MRKSVFISLPSARGVHPLTVWNLWDMRTELEKHGIYIGGSSVYRMPLGLARNELAGVFLSTSADLNYLLDDDVQVDVVWLPKMVSAVASGEIDILSAPCLLRDHSHGGAQDAKLFNIRPCGGLEEKGGLRVLECEQTGLGAVLVSRKVIQSLFDADVKYASRMLPGRPAAAIFRDDVVKASDLMPGAPPDLSVYALDDVIFSMKVRKLGYRIFACPFISTVHDGMAGCFADEVEKLERAQARAASEKAKPLLGPDGKELR